MTTSNTLSNNDYKIYFEKAISYEAYKVNFQDEIALGEKSAFFKYLPQNWQRQSRLDRKLKLNETLIESIHGIKNKINWLVITEHWCGDASQINPIIYKIAQESQGKINLRFLSLIHI